MRLIDADIYLKKICKYETDGCGSCKFQIICPADEPAVNAIPVDWIKEWLITFNGLSDVKGSFVIRMLLDSWEEKNRNELGKM